MSQEMREDWFGFTDIRDARYAVICAALCAAFALSAAMPDMLPGAAWEVVLTVAALFAAVLACAFTFGMFAILPAIVASGYVLWFGPELLKVLLVP